MNKIKTRITVGQTRTRSDYERALSHLQSQTDLKNWLEALIILMTTSEREVAYATKYNSETGKAVSIDWKVDDSSVTTQIDIVWNEESKFASTEICKKLKKIAKSITEVYEAKTGLLLILKQKRIVTFSDHFNTYHSDGMNIKLAQKFSGD